MNIKKIIWKVCEDSAGRAEYYPFLNRFKAMIANTSNNDDVMEVEGDTPEEAIGNARYLVKCMNMHDEAMDVILAFIRQSPTDTNTVKWAVNLLNKDKE